MPEHVIFGHGKLARSHGKPYVKICTNPVHFNTRLMYFCHVNKMLKNRVVLG